MEAAANAAFDAYREQYYEGGASSVYAWRTATGFAAAVAIRKVPSPPHPSSPIPDARRSRSGGP